MHLISIRKLRADVAKHPEVTSKIETWYRVVKAATWRHLGDVKIIYPDADQVGSFIVFNIKSYRLIVGVDYEKQIVFYKYFLTHSQYDREEWKNDPYF
jgi:mRNA interferase HigB